MGPNNLHKVPSAFLKCQDVSELNILPAVSQPPCPLYSPVGLSFLALNKEQSNRVHLAHHLHLHLNHPSDEALKAVLPGGNIPSCHVTTKDVTNMRERDDPCSTQNYIKNLCCLRSPPLQTKSARPCHLPGIGGYTLAMVAVDERS